MVSKYPSEVFDDFDRLAACRLRSVLFVASTGSRAVTRVSSGSTALEDTQEEEQDAGACLDT